MTVKGDGTGEAGEASNETHSLKKLDMKSLQAVRDRFGVPISDKDLKHVPFYRPPEDSPEMRYMRERRAELGGHIPARRKTSYALPAPPRSACAGQLKPSGHRHIRTNMAFRPLLSPPLTEHNLGARVVPAPAGNRGIGPGRRDRVPRYAW